MCNPRLYSTVNALSRALALANQPHASYQDLLDALAYLDDARAALVVACRAREAQASDGSDVSDRSGTRGSDRSGATLAIPASPLTRR